MGKVWSVVWSFCANETEREHTAACCRAAAVCSVRRVVRALAGGCSREVKSFYCRLVCAVTVRLPSTSLCRRLPKIEVILRAGTRSGRRASVSVCFCVRLSFLSCVLWVCVQKSSLAKRHEFGSPPRLFRRLSCLLYFGLAKRGGVCELCTAVILSARAFRQPYFRTVWIVPRAVRTCGSSRGL
jgi:hypothetical protein